MRSSPGQLAKKHAIDGKLVRLTRDVTTNGGDKFRAGTILRASCARGRFGVGVFAERWSNDPAGGRHRRGVRGLHPDDVELYDPAVNKSDFLKRYRRRR